MGISRTSHLRRRDGELNDGFVDAERSRVKGITDLTHLTGDRARQGPSVPVPSMLPAVRPCFAIGRLHLSALPPLAWGQAVKCLEIQSRMRRGSWNVPRSLAQAAFLVEAVVFIELASSPPLRESASGWRATCRMGAVPPTNQARITSIASTAIANNTAGVDGINMFISIFVPSLRRLIR